jgi:DNA (cytosine-5)-methyltransferase 1
VRKARWQGWGNYYGHPHLLWASPPCQAFSQAGDRLGAKDERNGWPWTLDAIDGARPTWVVCENVPGLCQHTTATCGDPMQCAGCYWEQWVLPEFRKRFAWVGVWKLNAADYGVPQTRRRVFLVAGPHAIGAPAPTHAHSSMTRTLFGELQPWVSMGQALGLVGTLAIGGGHNPNHAGDTRNYRDLTNEPSTTIPAIASGNAGPWVVETPRTRVGGVRFEQSSVHAPSPTIRGAAGGSSRPMLRHLERPSPCVTATEYKGLSANPRQDMNRATDALFLGTGRRRLTVEERATLQGFPDGYPFHGTKKQRYRQVGNAVPPALAEAIARCIPPE